LEAVTPPSQIKLVEELIRKHEGIIRSFIARRSGPAVLKRASIEDLFQETVAAACSSAGSYEYRGDSSFVTWISTIARRAIARCAASGKKEPQTLRIKRPESTGVGVYEMELAPRGRTPSSLVAAQERRAALHDAIRGLPSEHRRVITLYLLEERPLDEVVELTGREKTATCHLLARIMNKLRDTLANDGHPK
jgi:RNA polymerase sigma factor (sigma-70 family)